MLRNTPTRFASLVTRASLLAVAVLMLVPSPARGQTVAVEPYYAVTTADNVPLKAGDMDGYYHVALLEKGRVVWVDAEGGGWARVAYPPDLPVYVRAEEVEMSADGVFVSLTRQSGLKSVNQAGGFGKSWQRAMPRGEDAPIGTRMRLYAPIKDAGDKVIGYSVTPPPAARAYLKVGSLRAATEAEVKAYEASIPAQQMTEPETDPVVTEPAASEPEATDEDAANPDEQITPPDAGDEGDAAAVETTPSETDPAAGEDIDLRDPAAEPAQPETGEQPTADGGDDVTTIEQGGAADDAHSRLVGTLRQLSELFTQVQAQDSDTAELDEMAAELRRAISAQGDDAMGQRIASSLSQRLQLIEMRISARDARRELRAKRESIDASYTQIASQIRELETTRGYQFVGRLVRSSLYDGNRLPLMYRIVSVNESVPRTIGYIVPGDDALGVTNKLGEIVGVLGSSTLDRDLNLRIVTPTRIDTLGPGGLTVNGSGSGQPGS